MIGNRKEVLDEKGLEEVAMATGEGCYGNRRWLLWR